MTQQGATPLRRRRVFTSVACIALAALAGGCHDEGDADAPTNSGSKATQEKVVDAAQQRATPYKTPKSIDLKTWQTAYAPLEESTVTYRVPERWNVSASGRAKSLDDLVSSRVELTEIEDDEISLSSFAAGLGTDDRGTSPLRIARRKDGSFAYIVTQRVPVAPNEPDAGTVVFHYAIFAVDGRIAKLEVRYDERDDWRFADVAEAIVGTTQVIPQKLPT